jgi:hypothetical protein
MKLFSLLSLLLTSIVFANDAVLNSVQDVNQTFEELSSPRCKYCVVHPDEGYEAPKRATLRGMIKPNFPITQHGCEVKIYGWNPWSSKWELKAKATTGQDGMYYFRNIDLHESYYIRPCGKESYYHVAPDGELNGPFLDFPILTPS